MSREYGMHVPEVGSVGRRARCRNRATYPGLRRAQSLIPEETWFTMKPFKSCLHWRRGVKKKPRSKVYLKGCNSGEGTKGAKHPTVASVIGNNIVSSPTACKLHKCSYDAGFHASYRVYGLAKTLQWRSGPRVNIKIIDRHCAYPSVDRGRRFRFRDFLFKFSALDGETRPNKPTTRAFAVVGGCHASLQSSVRNGPVQYFVLNVPHSGTT